jgi:hypothetical protein
LSRGWCLAQEVHQLAIVVRTTSFELLSLAFVVVAPAWDFRVVGRSFANDGLPTESVGSLVVGELFSGTFL